LEDRTFQVSDGAASFTPIWQVAQASCAAPTVFLPVDAYGMRFSDGSLYNHNPTALVCERVQELHPLSEPSLITSLGGVTPLSLGALEVEPSRSPQVRFSGFEISTPLGTLARYTRKLESSRSEIVHEYLRSRLSFSKQGNVDSKPEYFRFTASRPVGGGSIWAWQGIDGWTTKAAIRDDVERYMDETKVIEDMRGCAAKLVALRKVREKTDLWESFAFDSIYYRCPVHDSRPCDFLELERRSDLIQHLAEDHAFVLQVVCRRAGRVEQSIFTHGSDTYRADTSDFYGWTCNKTHRETDTVFCYDDRSDFVKHLQDIHGIEKPRIVTREELEAFLDKGRCERKEKQRASYY
jgi:hypothetical protein